MNLSAVFDNPDFLRGVKHSLQARHYLSFLGPNKDTLEKEMVPSYHSIKRL